MATPRILAKFGWRPDPPDRRDKPYAYRLAAPVALPPKLDMSSKFPPAYDQLQTSSCTGNSSAGAVQYEYRKQGLPDVTPSRLMAYFNGRLLEGATDTDGGAVIRDVIKGIATNGICPETEWPFDPAKVCIAPFAKCYDDASGFRAVSYESVDQTETAIKMALFEDYPVIFGFTVFNAFMSDMVARTGVVPMPGLSDAPIGGHAVLIVGYDDSTRMFKVRNSWGPSWGDAGYFYLPYDYVLNNQLSDDFWVIKLIGAGADPVPEVADLTTTP